MTYLDQLHHQAHNQKADTMRRGDRLPYGHRPTVRLAVKQHQRWLAARRQGITATDVPAILGLSPYTSAFAVWDAKVNGTSKDLSGSYAVQRGNLMEAFLADWWAREEGRQILPTPALIAHPDHPVLLASLDRLGKEQDTTVVIECKTAGWRQREAWWDDQQMIPDHYAAQVLTQLWVTGLDTAHVVADVAGDLRTVTIHRDRAWEEAVWPHLEDFWRHVQEQTPPPVGWDPVADYPAMNRTWVPEPGSSREATHEETVDLEYWATLKADEKDTKRELDRLRGVIRHAMADTQTLTIGGQPAATITPTGLRAGTALKETTS